MPCADLQRRGEFLDERYRRVAPSALDVTDVGAVDAGAVGIVLLRPALGLAEATNVPAKASADFHGLLKTAMSPIDLQTISDIGLDLSHHFELLRVSLIDDKEASTPRKGVPMNFTDELQALAELKDRGILTEEEFQHRKAQLLAGNRTDGVSVADRSGPPQGHAGLTMADRLLIEQRVSNEMPSQTLAYVIWFFTALLGGHRFYLGRTGSGVGMLVLSITIAGLVVSLPWAIVDLFLIPGLVRERTDVIRDRLTLRTL